MGEDGREAFEGMVEMNKSEEGEVFASKVVDVACIKWVSNLGSS